MLRRLMVVLGAALGLVAIGAVGLPFWIPALIYRPTSLPPPLRASPAAFGLAGARAVDIGPGRLSGWWRPPPDRSAPVVLLAHGRSANLSTRAPVAAALAEGGFGVLLFDYRGYGGSPGRPSEAGLDEDTASAYAWLRGRGVQPGRIVLMGQSLGDAPAAQVAASRSACALVLVSPFTSLPDVLYERLGWPVRLRPPWPVNRFEVRRSAARLDAPVLLVASRADGLVPFEDTLALAASLRRPPRWLLMNGRHDGLLVKAAASGRLVRALRPLCP